MNWADRFGEWLAAPVRRWRYARRQRYITWAIAQAHLVDNQHTREYMEKSIYGDLLPPTR